MVERKYVSDKRILAYNPFEYVDKSLFNFMDGYTFLDFLKINRGYCESFTTTVDRPTDQLFSYNSYEPYAIINRGYENVNIDLRMCMRRPIDMECISYGSRYS